MLHMRITLGNFKIIYFIKIFFQFIFKSFRSYNKNKIRNNVIALKVSHVFVYILNRSQFTSNFPQFSIKISVVDHGFDAKYSHHAWNKCGK